MKRLLKIGSAIMVSIVLSTVLRMCYPRLGWIYLPDVFDHEVGYLVAGFLGSFIYELIYFGCIYLLGAVIFELVYKNLLAYTSKKFFFMLAGLALGLVLYLATAGIVNELWEKREVVFLCPMYSFVGVTYAWLYLRWVDPLLQKHVL